MGLKKFHLIIVVLTLLFITPAAFAQDLLARQAPVDKHMRKIDTLALRQVIEREEAQMPASKLYDEWSNKYAHRATELPDSFRINLRGFHMPTESRVVTSNFGARWGRQHKGLDIKVYIGDTIRAAFSGKVRVVRYEAAGYGKYVVIRHNNGLETIYGHMSAQLVQENQIVKAGQPIGLGGNTGRSTGSHLHFETRLCGVALNPALMFDFRNQDVVGDSYMFRKSTTRMKDRLQMPCVVRSATVVTWQVTCVVRQSLAVARQRKHLQQSRGSRWCLRREQWLKCVTTRWLLVRHSTAYQSVAV